MLCFPEGMHVCDDHPASERRPERIGEGQRFGGALRAVDADDGRAALGLVLEHTIVPRSQWLGGFSVLSVLLGGLASRQG